MSEITFCTILIISCEESKQDCVTQLQILTA